MAAGDRGERGDVLDHADLVVHRHHADQQRWRRERRAQCLGIEQPVGADRQEHRLESFVRQVGDRFQDAFVLGGDGDDAAPRRRPRAAAKRAAPLMAMLLLSVAPEVKTISRGSAPISPATCAARRFDRGFGGAAHDVLDAVRVAVLLGEPGQHGYDHAGVAAGCRLIVQIDGAVGTRNRVAHFLFYGVTPARRPVSAASGGHAWYAAMNASTAASVTFHGSETRIA